MSSLPEERLGQLRVAKLRALLGGRPASAGEGAPLGTGAAVATADGHAAVLIEQAGPRSLGGALTWAVRRNATDVVVIVDADAEVAGHLARQAALFAVPVTVERIVGTASEAAPPAPVAAVVSADAADGAAFEELLAGAGCEVVREHGVTRGEILGLEVARVVPGDGGPRLEVGVGRFDREISTMMFSGVPTAEALAKAVDLVRRHRVADGPPHPLRDLVPERWIRRLVLHDPALVGAAHLEVAETTVEPDSLRSAHPAAAVGETTDGRPLVVVATAGIDLDAVVLAADTRAALAPGADLVVCGPERSFVAPVRAVAAALEVPPRFVAVELSR